MTSEQIAQVAEANTWDQADDYWEAKYDEYAADWPNDDDFYDDYYGDGLYEEDEND